MGYMDKQPSRMQGSSHGWELGWGWELGRGRGAEALAFSVVPLPTALMCATLIGGI